MLDLRNCRQYMACCLKIKDKKGNIVPLKLNKPQGRFYDQVQELREMGTPVRVLVLKARQMGFSTVIEGMMFWSSATAFNAQGLVVAHQDEATNNLFAMTKRYYENLPEPVKPLRKASNGRELEFAAPTNAPPGTLGLNSSIRVATAGGRDLRLGRRAAGLAPLVHQGQLRRRPEPVQAGVSVLSGGSLYCQRHLYL